MNADLNLLHASSRPCPWLERFARTDADTTSLRSDPERRFGVATP
jgi:hypothetical protein